MNKKILVDWLTFTVGVHCFLRDFAHPNIYSDTDDALIMAPYHTDDNKLAQLRRFLGIPETVEFLSRRPLYGYATMYSCGGIKLAWGNSDTIMVDISGEGCRLLESVNSSLDWLGLIRDVGQLQRHNFSRLDVACDVFDGLKMQHLFRYTLEHRYISRWKSTPRVVQGREETIDFGTPQSRTMLRIYNKTLERQCKLGSDVEVPPNWIRLEMQMRDEAVDSFIREWQSRKDVSAVYLGLLANQLQFVKKRESNLERSKMVSWWLRVLDNSQPIPLAYKGGLEYNLQSLQQYLFIQAGSSIRVWTELHKAGLVLSEDKLSATEQLEKMTKHRKLNPKQQALLAELEALRNVPKG